MRLFINARRFSLVQSAMNQEQRKRRRRDGLLAFPTAFEIRAAFRVTLTQRLRGSTKRGYSCLLRCMRRRACRSSYRPNAPLAQIYRVMKLRANKLGNPPNSSSFNRAGNHRRFITTQRNL